MIEIIMDNCLRFDITNLDKDMLKQIKKDFRVNNPQYVNEQMMKSNTKNSKDSEVPKYLNMYSVKNNMIEIPRGWSSYLCYWLEQYNYEYDIIDNRLVTEIIDYPKLKFPLFKHQSKWVKKGHLLTQGTVESPCGSGKTIGGISLMTRCKQPSLIIVPDNELLKQWVNNLVNTLGEDILTWIGVLTSEKIEYGENRLKYKLPNKINTITITTNMSAYNLIEDNNFVNSFGFVLLDECHMVGARTFREVMNAFPAKYRYGLTATPFRNDSLTELIEAYCGTQFYTVTDDDLIDVGLVIKPELETIKTKFHYEYNPKYARYMYNKILSAMQRDERRNKLIVQKIADEVNEKRMVLVIAKRVDHCRLLAKMLAKEFPKKKSVRISIMAGEVYDYQTSENARKGEVDVIFAVDRAKQGLDIKPLETVMIVAPRKAKGEIEQIVGRVMRADCCFGKYKNGTDKQAKVIDFLDDKVPMLKNAYKERYSVYEKKCKL